MKYNASKSVLGGRWPASTSQTASLPTGDVRLHLPTLEVGVLSHLFAPRAHPPPRTTGREHPGGCQLGSAGPQPGALGEPGRELGGRPHTCRRQPEVVPPNLFFRPLQVTPGPVVGLASQTLGAACLSEVFGVPVLSHGDRGGPATVAALSPSSEGLENSLRAEGWLLSPVSERRSRL